MYIKKEFRILSIAAVVLIIGIIISYYNTSSLGYDNANIVSFDNEQLNIFDYEIRYEKVKDRYNKVKDYIPNEIIIIELI